MTPAELRSARHAFGLSAEGFARLVRVESGRTVRRWESGERDIPGPVAVLVEAITCGQFLLDRLSELEIPDELARDWMGHVEPAIERFRELLPADAVTKRRA